MKVFLSFQENRLDTFDGDIGVWKSAPGKGRKTPKGRQIDDAALVDVRALLGDLPRRRDLLIEFLHLIQDRYGHLSVQHLNALADELLLAQTEVCLLYTSPSPRDLSTSRMPSSA